MAKTVRMLAPYLLPTFHADAGMVVSNVPDDFAEFLVRSGDAVYHGEQPEDDPVPVTEPAPETPEAESEPETEDPEPKRPYGNAAKADWIHYALKVDKDLTVEQASAKSKVQ